MCGLAAIFAYGSGAPPVVESELLRIREAMIARGPDGAGLWRADDGRVGFAHRRLAIIDTGPTGAQPMASADGRLRIVFNGEIYNYHALRDRLEAEGRTFLSGSDTEVLLHLYDRDGPEMLAHLRGMYAFAIWDERRQGLFLARDAFGIKPLYIADDGKTIRIASQVKALLSGGAIDTAPDPAGHAGFFLLGSVPEPFTLYRAIRPLAPGHTLWVDRQGRHEERTVLDILAEFRNGAVADMPESGCRTDLAAHLDDSIRHHMVADVPVGAFLSAGLDSASIVAHAAEIEGAGLRTVTLSFDEFQGTSADEAPLATRVAECYGTRHQTVRVSADDFAGAYEPLLAAMDQPSIDGVNTYFVSKAAADLGLKVALSGIGGDEMFGGYDNFRTIPRMVRSLRPLRAVAPLNRLFRIVTGPAIRRFANPKYASFFEYGTTYGDAYMLRRGLFLPWELPDVMDSDMAREGWGGLNLRLRLSDTVAGVDLPELKVGALECAWYLRNQLLRDADWAGMAHSLEIRVPLVDFTLLRRVLPLRRTRHPVRKTDMALTPNRPLPAEILNRPKSGFHIPVDRWLPRDDRNLSPREPGLRRWARTLMQRTGTE